MTIDPTSLSARDIAASVRAGSLHPTAVAAAFLDVASNVEPELHAFKHLDPQQCLAEAAEMSDARRSGALAGVPLGVKDVIDTADMPTACGSRLYEGRRPAADASCVHIARHAGAFVVGKTVTTEFATASPGPTVNPHNRAHTPGGSSSGSAAAVAAGIVRLAFGTQTSGSTIRPAAFCGVVGFKPTFGMIDRTGVKPLSEALDTIGLYARDVADVALFASVVARRPDLFITKPVARPRIGIFRTSAWSSMDTECGKRFDAAVDLLGSHEDIDGPSWWTDVLAAQDAVFGWQASAALAFERDNHADQLTDVTREFLKGRAAFGYDDAVNAIAVQHRAIADIEALFGDNDILITPAALGEAPLGLRATGNPAMNIAWTLLGTPCLSLPAGTGPNGLPLALQIVARPGADAALLGFALSLESLLCQHFKVK